MAELGEQKVGGVVSIVSFFFVLYSAAEGIKLRDYVQLHREIAYFLSLLL